MNTEYNFNPQTDFKKVNGIYAKYIKRFLDVFFAALILICFFWVYLILALVVRVKMGSPVIHNAQRPGKIDKKSGKETIFNLYKFRSMTNAKDENGKLLPDDKRLTRFGRILRASSLDELPELINILKGDMSFVGPRPLGLKYIPYYSDIERHRHDVLPGLTGLAQVKGRNNLSWEEKFAFDLEYVKNISLWLDIKILFLTITKVLKREGIGQGEHRPVSLHIEREAKKESTKEE